MKTDPCRFCRLYALSLVPLAALLGVMLTLQLWLEPFAHTVANAVPPVVLGGSLRAMAPASTGSALMLALLLWAHPQAPAQTLADLPRLSKRAFVLLLPAYAVAASVSMGVCIGLGALAFHQPLRPVLDAVDSGLWRETALGLVSAYVDAGLVLLLARRFLARLQALPLLPAKLALACAVLLPARAMLGLVLEPLLPG